MPTRDRCAGQFTIELMVSMERVVSPGVGSALPAKLPQSPQTGRKPSPRRLDGPDTGPPCAGSFSGIKGHEVPPALRQLSLDL